MKRFSLSRTFSCEDVQEDVGRVPHVEVFHLQDTNSGEITNRITGESVLSPTKLPFQHCQRNLVRANSSRELLTDTAECMVLLIKEYDVTYHLHAQCTIHQAELIHASETTYLLI